MQRGVWIFFTWMLWASGLTAQLQTIYIPPPDYIGTAECTVNDYPYKYAIAAMDEPVFVSFDDLYGDEKNYYYRIRRFDENWHESQLLPQEYIDGFDSAMIEDEENSTATLQPYTHYSFRIPNENTRITKSGNYLIEILDENEEPVFNFPVMIYERSVTVGVQVKIPTLPDKIHSHQLVHFRVNIQHFPIVDPYSELKVFVLKNENPYDVRIFEKPVFNNGSSLDYYYPEKALFPGGAEFYSFETRNLRGYNRGLDSMRLHDFYEAYVTPYWPPAHYNDYKDIDGSYVVDSKHTDDAVLEADYVLVHFRLPADAVPEGKEVYVTGRFNQWRLEKKNRLRYNEKAGLYEVVIPLKQGYYDYYYVGKNSNGGIDWTAVIPSFFETENRYTVLVYYRPAGARYSRLIGMGQAISKPMSR